MAQAGDVFLSLAKYKIADLTPGKYDVLISTSDEDLILLEGVDKSQLPSYTSALYVKKSRPIRKPRASNR